MEDSGGPHVIGVLVGDQDAVDGGIAESNRVHQGENALAAWAAVDEQSVAFVPNPSALGSWSLKTRRPTLRGWDCRGSMK